MSIQRTLRGPQDRQYCLDTWRHHRHSRSMSVVDHFAMARGAIGVMAHSPRSGCRWHVARIRPHQRPVPKPVHVSLDALMPLPANQAKALCPHCHHPLSPTHRLRTTRTQRRIPSLVQMYLLPRPRPLALPLLLCAPSWHVCCYLLHARYYPSRHSLRTF